ncbi:hypothetical protein [Pseudomonas sp. D1-36]|uniref:hypothetical protein n=1 Tax=Pseudomonas sp. D1-36 TaxID=2817387 RepID=UPI003DA9A19A
MVARFISNSVVLLSISYCANTHEISYAFLIDDIEFRLGGELYEAVGIKGIKCSVELEQFLLALMPFDRSVSKKLCSMSWAYAEGDRVDLPAPLLLLEL